MITFLIYIDIYFHMFHEWIAFILFALLSLIGFALTIVGIGGTFVILIGALLYNLISWSVAISWTTIGILLGLAILGEVLEWIVTLFGAKKGGVSWHGLVGTVVGAVAGGVLLSVVPIVGTIIGLVLGAVVGAFLGEYYHTGKAQKAWKAAKSALVGRALVSICKFTIAFIQVFLILKQLS